MNRTKTYDAHRWSTVDTCYQSVSNTHTHSIN